MLMCLWKLETHYKIIDMSQTYDMIFFLLSVDSAI